MVRGFGIVVLLSTLALLILIPGCGIKISAGNLVTVSGTWDLISPFERTVIPAYNQGAKIQTQYSPSAIQLVRKGESDIALLGREPAASDVKGLKDNVISYDAVCIIVDENSYLGGEYWQNVTPLRKSAGFNNLTTEELKGIFKNDITPFGLRWNWTYYSWKPSFQDLNTGSYSSFYTWMPDYKVIFSAINLTPGKYDTQTLLYQQLGINEKEKVKAWNNQYSDSKLGAEEEILSVQYPPNAPYIADSGDFNYKVGFVTRRVIPVAMEHAPIKVVSVNGIDPMQDIQAIYDGTYLFSRKIHLITQENPAASTAQFVNYLKSPAGQQDMKEAGYLPLPGN